MINIMNALRARGIGVGSKLEGDAETTDVRQNKTFMNEDGGPFTGGIPTRDAGGAVTVTPGANPTTLQPGIYDNSIVVAGDADLVSANIKAGANIFNVAGKTQVVDTTEAANPAAAGDIKAPKVTFVNGVKVTGNQADNGPAAAETVNLTTQNQEYTIATGFHSGLRKIKAVITGLVAGVIKAGTTVGGIAGTFTNDATATAATMLVGFTAWVKGVLVEGGVPSKAAATITPGTAQQTIGAGQYLAGDQTIDTLGGDAPQSAVRSDYTFSSNAAGRAKAGTMAVNGSQTATLEISGAAKPTKAVPAGFSPGGTITAQLAPELASLILENNTLGGVLGTLKQGKKWASGKSNVGTGTGAATLAVSGLAFTPKYIIAAVNGGSINGYRWKNISVYANNTFEGVSSRASDREVNMSVKGDYTTTIGSGTVSAGGFTITVEKDSASAEYVWIAFGD